MNYLLSIDHLEKSFNKKKVLNSFNLNIQKNNIYGLIGPNGAGKTTLIRLINQIYKPDKGYIYFNGEKFSRKHIKQIGYMPEERGLYMNMYVEEQLIYLGQLKGICKKKIKKKIDKWFQYFNINEWRNKKISVLSKGMAQKIQFIASILHEPKLIIFDEPFSGFDPLNINIICKEILILKKKGHSILLSTHRMEYAEDICDEIIFIKNSHKIFQGTPISIKNYFKKNEYSIEIELYKQDILEKFLKTHEVLKIKKNKNNYNFSIKKSKKITKEELLKSLICIGKIHSFQERIPSLEEIFIEVIKKRKCIKYF